MDDYDPDATTENPDNDRAPAVRFETCDGMRCPACETDEMWFAFTCDGTVPTCRCDACAHTVTLDGYLHGIGMSDTDIVGLAFLSAAGAA